MDRARKLDEAELWRFRALVSEQRALSAEITITNIKLQDISLEIDGFQKAMFDKYGCTNFDTEGNLLYEGKEPEGE